MIIPTTTICIPYVTQSGFEYMNDDSGPTIDCPWRWNTKPKIPIILPMIASVFPPFMVFLTSSGKKG